MNPPGSAGSMAPVTAGASAPASTVVLDGERHHAIRGYDGLPSFLMSVPSDTDVWLFVTSRGGLTAGRVDPEGSVFPYETEDKLHDAHHHTGPVTLVRVLRPGGSGVLWEPFSERAAEEFTVERNLYKNVTGNRLTFEEINHDLGLRFRYRWSACDPFGLVRTARLENTGEEPVDAVLLDGVRNVLPYGAPLALYQQSSSLVDAYKRADLDPETGLAVFSLTSRILDRPEAAEVLRATTAWSTGLPGTRVHLSGDAVAAFRRGREVPAGNVLTGGRGGYLAVATLGLDPGGGAAWHLVLDARRSHEDIAGLRVRLRDPRDLDVEIEEALDAARDNLRRTVGSADGIQLTADDTAAAHHFTNVLFNTMRGGVFADGYTVSAADVRAFARARNRPVSARHRALLQGLPESVGIHALREAAAASGDPDLVRIVLEYLPLTFARRHGDPSRPWNRFSIRVRNPDGSRALSYEGNWRDIFQNWESLCRSFPEFLPHVIAKFVNASTVDGFNPYRITRDGVDWETPDPAHPWAHIGYWGDHQIVYLLRLLEAWPRFSPGALESHLHRAVFCYAEVPYRIKPHADIVRNPRETIVFDHELHARIGERVADMGSDGRLLLAPDGSVLRVTLLEKLLVPLLSRISNLVPSGGIWMNTQRPEWNDANNALVGNGLSVVTLCHLRRYTAFLRDLLERTGGTPAPVGREVVSWMEDLRSILERQAAGDDDEAARARYVDAAGRAFQRYRDAVYGHGFSGAREVTRSSVTRFCAAALSCLDRAIRANRRDDGLYHAYNLLERSGPGDGIRIRRLPEMLEGQVAALDSGTLGPAEALETVSSLFSSRLYRKDQQSFLLYPRIELPSFFDRNMIPGGAVGNLPLLGELIREGDRSVVVLDAEGVLRFAPDLSNAADLEAALDRLGPRERPGAPPVQQREAMLDLFDLVFRHRSFTGRSQTMYAYEGVGCIYWHMVAKLLLAVQEILHAAAPGDPARPGLVEAYYRIRAGLGFEKSPEAYGAFPTDPYSHTPARGGARQPGMTGQVKEEILTRLGELGVRVEDGLLAFRPTLLRRREFLAAAREMAYYDVQGEAASVPVPEGALAFTVFQVPVVYHRTAGEGWIRVGVGGEGRPGDRLDHAASRALFERRGTVARIDVGIPEDSLLD